MIGFIRQSYHQYRRFLDNKDGSTAIEFGVLVIPFSMLLFSIIELAVVFLIGTTMEYAMTKSAREIRTGEFQGSCGTAKEFKKLVCSNMVGLGRCDNIRVDVVSSSSGGFDPSLLPDTSTNEDPSDPGKPIIAPDEYIKTAGGDMVIVRVQYYYLLALPGKYTHLANVPGNQRVITSMTAFRNEPFPNSC